MTDGCPTGDPEPPDDERYRVYHIADHESYAEAIVRGVADATDRDALALSPLARSVDPDAIDDVFSRRPEGRADSLAFTFEGYDVVVTPSWVYVRRGG